MTPASEAETGTEGFTLIEMLVVIAILVVVTAVGSLGLAAVRDRQIGEGARTDIVAALKRARLDAIRQGHRAAVVFDIAQRQIRADGRPPIAVDPRVTLHVTTSSKVEQQGLPAIVFLADGRSSGGNVEIVADGMSRFVSVDWLLGTVREASDAAR
jgi:general secretion pathway protein H